MQWNIHPRNATRHTHTSNHSGPLTSTQINGPEVIQHQITYLAEYPT